MSVVLYQPDDALAVRLPTGIGPLAEYIKAIQAAIVGTLFEIPVAENRALVVSIFPERKALCWVDAEGGTEMPNEAAELSRIVSSIDPPEVVQGPVAFAFRYSEHNGNPANWIPNPNEWGAIAIGLGKKMSIDEVLQTLLENH